MQTRTTARYDSPMKWPRTSAPKAALLVCGAALALVFMLTQAWSKEAPARVARIVGPYDSQDGCEKCHVQEVMAWRASSHHGTLDLLRTHEEAPKIFAKLREAKAEGLGTSNDPRLATRCARCHATTYVRPNHTEGMPLWGVSCESCHGPAERWVHGHGAYRVSGRMSAEQKSRLEGPEDRAARLSDATAAGMVRPENLYGLATNCLRCHIVDDAELVEVGGHPSQSPGFEFMSWTQGEVRHNFLLTSENAPSAPERRRVMYVVGTLAALEANVRALAKAKDRGGYATAIISRIEASVETLLDLSDLIEDKQIGERLGEMIALVYDEDEEEALEFVRPGNADQVTGLAESLRGLAAKLAAGLAVGTTSLAALDERLEKVTPKGAPYEPKSDK